MIIDSHEHVIITTEKQIEKLDEAGVDKAILFSTTSHIEACNTLNEVQQEMKRLNSVLGGNNANQKRVNDILNSAKELCKVIENHKDRFLGFGNIPLSLSQEETSLWIQDNIIKNNLKGIGETAPATPASANALEKIFISLSDHKNLPIWIHTFNPVTIKEIKIIMSLCDKYPNIPVIFGHMGGSNWLDIIDFAKNNKNIYLDLSAAFTTLSIKLAINTLPSKCLFSSDAPYGEPELNIQMIENLSQSNTISSMVLGENIINLLDL